MSRLDRHVAQVQNKLALHRFVHAVAWTLLALGAAVLLAVLLEKLVGLVVPRGWQVLIAGAGLAVVAAGVWAVVRRPTRHEAAVAIDRKLDLKEKFSTALYVRPSTDPFALAAVRDAEQTAEQVRLERQFPLSFPKVAWGVALLAALAWGGRYLPNFDLFGRKEAVQKKAEQLALVKTAEGNVLRAKLAIESMPKSVRDEEQFKKIQGDLEKFLRPSGLQDPAKAMRRADQALMDVSEALAKQAEAARVADANNKQMFSTMERADESTPVGKVQNEIRSGKFTDAVADMSKVLDKFEKADDQTKNQMQQQMQQLAQQLQNQANNQQVQQQIQQQLQQAGATQQQAQQMQNLMQQAANGVPGAAQQLQQAAQQAAAQMNNGNGPTPQQQQQINQLMQQAQAAANAQAQAAAMAQGAQAMAQGMQAAQQQGQQGGQQGAQQGGQQGAQQGGQQGGQQGMANAQQQMQQALQQMQANQQAAQQAAAQQAAAQQAAGQQAGQQGQGQGQGQGQNGQGQQGGQQAQNAGQGQWGQGNPNQQGQGQGQAGIGQGGNTGSVFAPFGLKQEIAPSQDDEKGKILASTFVKMDALRGDAKAQLSQVTAAAQKDATDDVDAEHVSGQARKAAEEYFATMQKEAAPAAKAEK